MRFAFTDEQEELRRGARRFLERSSTSRHVRAAMASELGFDPAVWRAVGGDLGWTSLIIPEVYGGAGLTWVELVAVLEECGRSLLPAPLFSTVALGASALLVAGSDAQRREHLPELAAGRRIATLAHSEANGRWDARAVEASARREGDGFVLEGKKTLVVDGAAADLLVVAARAADSEGTEGISLFLVPASTRGLTRRPLAALDPTRRLAEVHLEAARLPASALLGEEGAGGAALERILDLACVALAAEQLGGAARCLELAVEHARTRVQFGRPIGSFQAVKHACADMLVNVEAARSAAYAGGWAAADPAELPVAAALAKAICSDAFFRCAAACIQIHGGIGFTWEHDAHLFLRRAQTSAVLFGDAAYHRERIARVLGL